MKVVEFTDYRCEFCARHAREVLPRLRQRYGSRIRYEIRALPVEESSPAAVDPFAAALCADDMGLFWPVHDLLFRVGGSIDPLTLRKELRVIKADPDRLLGCVRSMSKFPLILEDVSMARRLGITGTPAFVIDGQVVQGGKSLEVLADRIDTALQANAKG